MQKRIPGFSLMEVVIAIAVIGIFFSGVTLVFFTIGKGIMVTRTRTVATNLAQEKIESLKNVTFSRLRVTSESDLTTYGYDNTFYPPETGILVGNIPYTRRVIIQRAGEDGSGQLIEMQPDAGDTGIKKITVTISWVENGTDERSFSLSNVRQDPNRRPLDGSIIGQIQDKDSLAAISGVQVSVVDNLNWNALSDSLGNYSIKVATGTYQVKASKAGYWPYESPSLNVGSSPLTHDFKLKQMATGTVTGYVFINDHLVISKVVASTETVTGEDVEWVELYNPTTFSWTINSNFWLAYCDEFSAWHWLNTTYPDSPPTYAKLIVYNTVIPPNGYYLIANTGTITLPGLTIGADATYVYNNPSDLIEEDKKGGIGLWYLAGSVWKNDFLGWAPSAENAPTGEWPTIKNSQGLNKGETHVRYSVPGAVYANQGNAFDSDSNTANFLPNTVISQANDTYPKNSTYSAAPCSGYPAYGATITCSDGLSSYTTAYMVDSTGNKLAYFQLPTVATGTWITSVSFKGTSGYSAYQEINNVSVLTSGQMLGITNADTTPAWPYTGRNYIILTSPLSTGLVIGAVKNGSTGLSGIRVESGTNYTSSIGGGNYTLPLPAGTYNITANPSNLNGSYVSQTIENVVVTAGQITSGVNFDISPGGAVTGRVLSNADDNLPDVLVIAYDNNGNESRSALTQSDGTYVISNLPTSGNPFAVRPSLDSSESATPGQVDVNVVSGSTLWISTFSVSSAFGNITGKVQYNNVDINTGVLIIATTGTISGNPPAFDYALRNSGALYYGSVSHSDGSYIVQVRGGYTYNLYGWYTTMSGGISSTTSKSATVNNISAGSTETVDFSWP